MIRAALLAAVAAAPLAAQEMSEDDVKRLALEAILENPEIVMEAVAILREREAAEQAAAAQVALAERADELTSGENAPVLGNPEGDVTLVEFFDYNCPYCRRAAEGVETLIAADPELRVVLREFPILGEDSVTAARASLAAEMQGGYEAFHHALMRGSGRVDDVAIEEAAEAAGLDLERLRADMEAPEIGAHIETTMELAEALGVTGTPAFVVGDTVVPGAVPAEELAALIEEIRAAE
jgi:protein-disulfide isomerase